MSRYDVMVVTRPGGGLGFRLAGVPVEEVEEAKAAERIGALLADPRLGILALEEELLARLPAPLLARVEREGVPVLLPFALPGRWGEAGRGEAYVAAMIRRAIGYHIKIQGWEAR